jgi:hypothetical protein
VSRPNILFISTDQQHYTALGVTDPRLKTPAPILTLAVAPDFHTGGAVLAGAEGAGLWRSDDGGYTFAPVAGAPQVVNALLALPGGWLLSSAEHIWRSADGLNWTATDQPPALTFLATSDGVLAGGMDGVYWVE